MNYRHKTCFKVIRFPDDFIEEQRGIRECCDPFLVLADTTSNDSYKNDLTGVVIKSSDASDIIDFLIEKCDDATTLPLLGNVVTFPQDNLARGFVFDWKQYLLTFGEGSYTIKVSFTISGVVGSYEYGKYQLKEYSIENASDTVRIRSVFNSYLERESIDFTDSGFTDTLRFKGFFGYRDPKTDVNQLISIGKTSEKVKRENRNIYVLNTSPIKHHITKRLIDFHLLNEDICFMSDHNKLNHQYDLFDKPVVLESISDISYIGRLAKVSVEFSDRVKNQVSFYNRK